MKSTDIAMIILIASVSIGIAFGLVSAIPGLKLSDDPVKLQEAEEYSAVVEDPNPDVFNEEDAINPTIGVTIGGSSGDR